MCDELSEKLLALGERYLSQPSDAPLLAVWRMTYRDGLTNAQIAERLQLCVRQVRNRRNAARRIIIGSEEALWGLREQTPHEAARVWKEEGHTVLPSHDLTLLEVLRRRRV